MTDEISPLYRVVHGTFLVKGWRPDGDGVRFRPNDLRLLQFAGGFDATDSDDRSVNVRCEAYDAPELHYRAARGPFRSQPRGIAARDALLGVIGFGAPQPKPGDPSTLMNPDLIPGVLLTRRGTGIPGGGSARAVGYLLVKTPDRDWSSLEDGSLIDPDPDLLRSTVNYEMLASGEVYPAIVDDLPASHRAVFLEALDRAMRESRGVWEPGQDATSEFILDGPSSIEPGGALIYPSLFRKCLDYLVAVRETPGVSIVDWMRKTHIQAAVTGDASQDEDDVLYLGGGDEPSFLSWVVTHDPATRTVGLRPEIRESFFRAVFALHPWHRIPLADPADWDGFARGESPWVFVRTEPATGDLLRKIATCRAERCPVSKKHPYYRGEALDLSGALIPTRVPCQPIVPVHTNRGKVCLMGWYPAARFSSRSATGEPVSPGSDVDNELFVPVGNIAHPWADARYFDGYKLREVLSAETFHHDYLGRLELDLDRDAWVTNLIKCYMFKQSNVRTYERLNWIADVKVKATFETDMFKIADTCVQEHLAAEMAHCQPRLIITLGDVPCSVMHGLEGSTADKRDGVFDRLMGVILPAGALAPEEVALGVTRPDPWNRYTIVHLLHPENYLKASRAVSDGPADHPLAVKGRQLVDRVNEHLLRVRAYIDEHQILATPDLV
jgi:hypothetical protein